MRGLAVLVLFVLPLLAQTAQKDSAPQTTPNRQPPIARRHAPTRGVLLAGPAQQVAMAETRLRDAAVTGDFGNLAKLLAADYSMILPAGEMLDKNGILTALRGGVLKGTNLEVSGLHVKMLGSSAGVVTARVGVKQQDVTRAFRLTDVWHKQSGQWKLVNSQTTAIKKSE